MNSKKSYIIISPCKNEGEFLPKVIKSVFNQTILPKLWLIVDDGSKDTSPQIIEKTKKRAPFPLKSIRLKSRERDLGIGYSIVCRRGFKEAIKYCQKNQIDWQYIGLLDTDIVLPPNYYDTIINKFEANRNLGIISGSIYVKKNNKLNSENSRDDLPRGAHRVWRRKCFDETGGYLETYTPDVVSNVKANLKGWTLEKMEHLKTIQLRATSSAEGLWKGYIYKGEANYFLRCSPLFILLKGIKFLFSRRPYLCIPFFQGYIKALIKNKDRIKDKEIINYMRTDLTKNKIRSWIKLLGENLF